MITGTYTVCKKAETEICRSQRLWYVQRNDHTRENKPATGYLLKRSSGLLRL